MNKYSIGWRQIKLGRITRLQLLFCGGVINNALRIIDN